MNEKIKTLIWFIQRPSFWPHMVALLTRRISGDGGHESRAVEAGAWAAAQAVSVGSALTTLGLIKSEADLAPPLDPALLAEAERRALQSKVVMGGPGDMDLLYQAVRASAAKRVVETGVAYGWSSLAALAALETTQGKLFSVDMPYPKQNNEAFVGIVIPDRWRDRWTLIRKPDRNGLKEAIRRAGGTIDLCHFDSDKSYAGRMYAFPLLWAALKPGGVFISDDIQDNFGFRDFCEAQGVSFCITESDGKYVGITRKPLSRTAR